MNLLGMGSMEILFILVLAFIFLGPDRMIDAAKMLGKLVREGRKFAADLPQLTLEDDDIKLINKSEGAPTPNRQPSEPKPYKPYQESQDAEIDGQTNSEGPVAHKPTRTSPAIPSEATDEPPTA